MKRLPFSDKIKEKMTAALDGADFKPEDFAFFETIAINDLPVSKIGSIYNGARMKLATLEAMTNYVNKEGFLPLHTLHKQGSELPKGRVFAAEMNKTMQNGRPVNEMRALFYVPLNTAAGIELAANIDSGIINEVSVGSRPQKLTCSGGHDGKGCNFDYMAPNTFMNWLDQTCPNDHTIGKDGTHVLFDGLDKFYELSLVSQGAADHASIVSPQKAITASNDDAFELQILYATKGKEKENVMKLSAAQIAELKAGFETDGKRAIDAKFDGVNQAMSLIKDDMTLSDAEAARALFKTELAKFNAANPEVDPKTKKPEVDDKLNLSINEIMDLKLDLRQATKDVETLTASNTAKDVTIANLTTEVSTLKDNKVQLDALTSQVTPVKEFLKKAAQGLLVASGDTTTQAPESLTELVASIQTSQAKLSKLPTGGLLLSSETGSTGNNPGGNATTAERDMSSFKVKKN